MTGAGRSDIEEGWDLDNPERTAAQAGKEVLPGQSVGRTIPVKVAPDGRELSDDALDHLRMILLHRPDIEVLRVEILPDRCTLCDEILRWAQAVRR